ncbi:MAG: WYL domain-containing transcriptional regulator [Thermomicrobium sp.]|uniref:helix-turn-helix transcriptional regulator n=1 Tax=Thermomicrobium sp. TaxID=1969469 RepID=UPI001B24C236|nr:WYL domain-containing protein [Thermomicrobium sp.]MBO9351739.1 WYL domain-containing transcriptional regulator [Thermomicrobium sp.]
MLGSGAAVIERLGEGNRVARLVDLLVTLAQAPKRYTRRELAARYQVSERQIGKDLQFLRERLGLAIERAPGGGYYLVSVPRLPSLQLELPQALALLLAAEAGHMIPGISSQELSAALERLRAILPDKMRTLLEHSLQARRPSRLDEHRQKRLFALLEAMALQHTVEMTYRTASRGNQAESRRFDPYCVFPFGRSWYVVGWCHLRSDVRTFKVDRIEYLRDTRVPFRVRSDFSLREFLTKSWGVFQTSELPTEEVELEFSQTAAPWIAEEEWHPSQEIDPLPDGRIRFRVRIPVTPDFVRWVLNYGVDVTVIRPESLREQVLAQARGILRHYGVRETGQLGTAEAAR